MTEVLDMGANNRPDSYNSQGTVSISAEMEDNLNATPPHKARLKPLYLRLQEDFDSKQREQAAAAREKFRLEKGANIPTTAIIQGKAAVPRALSPIKKVDHVKYPIWGSGSPIRPASSIPETYKPLVEGRSKIATYIHTWAVEVEEAMAKRAAQEEARKAAAQERAERPRSHAPRSRSNSSSPSVAPRSLSFARMQSMARDTPRTPRTPKTPTRLRSARPASHTKQQRRMTRKRKVDKLPHPVIDYQGRIRMFEDLEFPPDENSLGEVPRAKVTSWRRVGDIYKAVKSQLTLFGSDAIVPTDVVQGALGDCWLLASISALAEYPAVIKRIFRYPRNEADEPVLSPDGHYILRFFDIETGQYVRVTIDDRIPCGAKGQPVFARSRRPEAWVMLLEKAVAKYCGSYKGVESGWSAWAFRTLTGYSCAGFMNWKGGWTPVRAFTNTVGKQHGRLYRERKLRLDPKDKYQGWTLVYRLIDWMHDDEHDYVFSAGTKGSGDDAAMVKGLFQSHAYSMLEVMQVEEGLTLVLLRNPHGKGEWTGDWCDGSPKWEENPKVKEMAEAFSKMDQGNDGAFWMQFETDFMEFFQRIDVVRFPKEGKDKDGDGQADGDDVYNSSDEPFDEYGDLDLDDFLPATTEKEVRQQFQKIDQDNDGFILRSELRAYLQALSDKRLTPEIISRLVDEVDVVVEPNRAISYQEFRAVYSI